MIKRSLIALIGILLFVYPCSSQSYPTKPVRIIVGYAPGGGNDIVARLIGRSFQELTRIPFVVENKPGADTVIATSYVAKAEPDGYTLLVTGMGGFTITPAIQGWRLPYDATKDFIPVGTIARFAYVLATNNAVPATTPEELIDYARANSGKLNYGDSGPPGRLMTELFAQRANLALNRIFYKGSGATSQALLTNEVQVVISDATALMAHRASGKVKILAVTSRNRLKSFPDIPALAETKALANFDFDAWVGLFAPAGTPASVISVLADLVAKTATQAGFQNALNKIGADIVGDTPAQAAMRVKLDLVHNAEAARLANIISAQDDR